MLVETLALSKSFGPRRAVDGVSFALPPATITGLLGANGAGKSTTMRMLAGALLPDSGTARIAGNDIVTARPQAQRDLGYLPEAANGFSILTVYEFLIFAAEARGLFGDEGRQAAKRIAGLLDLVRALGRPLGSLSKGWRQRAWLAQALIHDPSVLILDEPTDGLDPKQKIDLRALLRKIARDRAILMSTHILEEAEELCDHLIVMHEGRIAADAPKSDLADSRGRLAPAVIALTSPGCTTSPAAE